MSLTLQQLDGILNSPVARSRSRVALILAAKTKASTPLPDNPIEADIDVWNQRKILARRIQLPGGADEYVGKMSSAVMAYMSSSPAVPIVGTDDASLTPEQKASIDSLMRDAFLAVFDTFLGT